MKFPYSMLKDYVQTNLTAEQAGDLLTMAGFELEGIEEVSGEPVLDIKVMSNRGDGLSILGLAREMLAKDPTTQPTELYRSKQERFAAESTGRVAIETPHCTRFAARLFTNVRNGQSPAWIQDRLTKAGMRPISLIVDLTNYVMLERGQPMHAYDFDKLSGGKLVARPGRAGEKVTTLDGQERELTPDMMVIADADRPVGVAGVMGGQDTEVSEATTTILLEAAHFVNTSVRKTRRALGLSTEASYRFERSVDPEGVLAAIERFTELLEGATVTETVDVYPAPPQQPTIRLRLERAERLLGMKITVAEARSYLTKLGFHLADDQTVSPPTWRPDVVREEDVIEELGRVHGYNKIPEALPHGSTTLGGPQGFVAWKDRVREAAVRLGFVQTISHSLRSDSPLDNLTLPRIGPRGIQDPEMMWLRNSVLPSLADAARRNGGKNLHLFEMGQVFGKHEGKTLESGRIGFLSQGLLEPAWWQEKSGEQASFFSLKGSLEALAEQLKFAEPQSPDKRLHPTRQAQVMARGKTVGVLGQIDPDAADQAGLPSDTVLAELDLEALYEASSDEIHVKEISRNPAIRRDLAFLIEKSVPFSNIVRAIESGAGPVLEKQWLFDVYEGKGVPEGSHSLAVALQLRKLGANLTDEEANQVREQVVAELAKLGATPR